MIQIPSIDSTYEWACRERVIQTVSRIHVSIPLATNSGFGPVGISRVFVLIPVKLVK